jgi:hypothetical protein
MLAMLHKRSPAVLREQVGQVVTFTSDWLADAAEFRVVAHQVRWDEFQDYFDAQQGSSFVSQTRLGAGISNSGADETAIV